MDEWREVINLLQTVNIRLSCAKTLAQPSNSGFSVESTTLEINFGARKKV